MRRNSNTDRPQGWRLRPRLQVIVVALAAASLGGGHVVTQAIAADTTPSAPRASRPVAVPEVDLPAATVSLSAVHDLSRARVGAAADFAGGLDSAPPQALAAYQRAAAIINTATECHLDWQILAAIGRVESAHGREGLEGKDAAHFLTKKGVVRPALRGAPLDGRQHRGTQRDTDAGVLDGDKRWDAPIGPMGLMPATWKAVAVDADGDGRRNPQDLDDAALGSAVLLCAEKRDLSRPRQLRAALTAYRLAPGFVRTVLDLAERFERESAVPIGFSAPSVLQVPLAMPSLCGCSDRAGDPVTPRDKKRPQAAPASPQGSPGAGRPHQPTASAAPTPAPTPALTPSPQPSAPAPSTPPEPEPTAPVSCPPTSPEDPAPESEPTGCPAPTEPPVPAETSAAAPLVAADPAMQTESAS